MGGEADSAGCLDFLSIIVESPADDRLGTVFVCGCSLGRELIDFIALDVVGPVCASTTRVLVKIKKQTKVISRARIGVI